MMDDWSRIAEQVMLSTVENKIRVLAITSPAPAAGVSSVALGLASTFARSGRKTLLLDLSSGAAHGPLAVAWSPETPWHSNALMVDADGLARLAVMPSPETRALFNNVELLQAAFARDFSDYATIILDLPALEAVATDGLNPIAIARAADAVFIVAPTGRTTRDDLVSASLQLRQAGTSISGVIMNDQYCVTLGAAIADMSTARLGRIFPRLAASIARKARASTYLTRHFRVAS